MTYEVKNTPFGQTNKTRTSRTDLPFVSPTHTRDKLEDGLHHPDITKNKFTYEAFVVERGKKIPIEQVHFKLPDSHGNAKDILVVKAWCPEIHRLEHPDEKLYDEQGNLIPRDIPCYFLHDFYAISSEVSNKGIPDIDDKILISVQNDEYYYHAIIQASSKNAGSKKRNDSEVSDNTPRLEDTIELPDGSIVPNSSDKQPLSGQEKYPVPRTPGLYPVHKRNINPYADFEMVIIQNTSILYPKRYIKALEAMREQYKQDTGKDLGITSGYRDVNLQRILYKEYLDRLKRPPQVAKPGFSLHNSGLAIDLTTGQVYNNKFENLGLKGQGSKNEAFTAVQNENFGEVAKWLSINSEKFGFVWAGFSFRELWHYELDINKLPENLKGDTTGDKLVS